MFIGISAIVGAFIFGGSTWFLERNYQLKISEKEAPPIPVAPQHESKATAAEPTNPKLEPPGFREKVDLIRFSLGGGGISVGYAPEQLRQKPVAPFNLAGYSPVTLRMGKDTLFFTFKVWSGTGQSPVEVIDNEFVVRPPQWDRNSNANALEVVNEKGLPVFQMIRKTPSHLVVNGVFPFPAGMIIATDQKTVFNPDENVMRATLSLLTPIFKYPSWKYPGEYAKQ